MRAAELFPWMEMLPREKHDAAIEDYFDIPAREFSAASPGGDLIGYHASGVDAIVRAIEDAQVNANDVVIDLGSGLGKVVFMTRLLTRASVRGIEIQPALVARARASATRLGLDVSFEEGDARRAFLDDGTVFFLYTPFIGAALTAVLERLRAVAMLHPIRVCALGLDLHREAPWLLPRASDAFWLTTYDASLPSAAPHAPSE